MNILLYLFYEFCLLLSAEEANNYSGKKGIPKTYKVAELLAKL